MNVSCDSDNLMRATLESAKTAPDDLRISAARALIDNWQVSLPALMQAIEKMDKTEASTWEAAELRQMVFLTGIVKTILDSKNQAIQFFRQCDKEEIVKRLLWAARGNNTDLRLNAASILANTVDNTNVCFVLHHLRDKDVTDNGRANLLGIARAVASYAYKDNVEAILETVEIVKQNLGTRLAGLAQTQQLLFDLRARAEKSSNFAIPLSGALSRSCKGYLYNSPLSRSD